MTFFFQESIRVVQKQPTHGLRSSRYSKSQLKHLESRLLAIGDSDPKLKALVGYRNAIVPEMMRSLGRQTKTAAVAELNPKEDDHRPVYPLAYEQFTIHSDDVLADALVKGLLTKLCVADDSTLDVAPDQHLRVYAESAYTGAMPGLTYLHHLARDRRGYDARSDYKLHMPTDIEGVGVDFAGMSITGQGSHNMLPLTVGFTLWPDIWQ